MTNKHKASVQLISWGAGIQAIKVPNQSGILGDVVLGFDDMEGKRKIRQKFFKCQKWTNNLIIVFENSFEKNIIRLFEEQVHRKHNRTSGESHFLCQNEDWK